MRFFILTFGSFRLHVKRMINREFEQRGVGWNFRLQRVKRERRFLLVKACAETTDFILQRFFALGQRFNFRLPRRRIFLLQVAGDDFRHALAVSLLGSELSPGFVAPAISGSGGGGSIPLGARIGIPPGVPMPGGLSPIGVRMWNTLVRYGAYVVDQHDGTAPVVFFADPRSVSPDQIAPLRNAGGDLDRIMPAVRVVQ